MPKRALFVGINEYDNISPLGGCVLDARSMEGLLARNADGSPNYSCRLLTSENDNVSRTRLREVWEELFDNFTEDILFYFSGHGAITQNGGYLVTQDATDRDLGLPMDDLLGLANQSKAREVLLILDCCFSGALGNPQHLQVSSVFSNQSQLREGVTILSASRPSQVAIEKTEGHGLFTWLVLNALRGGAADVRGIVSAASIYAYVEQVLGPWEQRPLYKSHADHLSPVRKCEPVVPDELLRQLPKFFDKATSRYQLDPSYEASSPSAIPEHVSIYQTFAQYRDARLLRTVSRGHLYYTVLESGTVELTQLGQLYWLLAKEERI